MAHNLHHTTTREPRNVEQIVKAAQEYEYNDQVPLRYWLRTATALLREADIYQREGDDETTYLLLFRHAHLILVHLTTHPQAKDPITKTQLAEAKQEVNKNLKALDVLKPQLNEIHTRFSQLVTEREARQGLYTSRNLQDTSTVSNLAVPATPRTSYQLQGHEHRDLAVQLAQREFTRRAGSRQSVQGHGNGDDLSHRLQAMRSRMEPSQKPISVNETAAESQRRDGYRYPRVRVHEARDILEPVFPAQGPIQLQPAPQSPPVVPPKPGRQAIDVPPPRPDKLQADTPDAGLEAPTTYTFAPSATLENGAPLRTLFLPQTLRMTFLRIAHQNTLANLETCAFLAGSLISNALFVSKLIVPAQVATSDTCEMTNESQLFDYVDQEVDLMILGWIHTHPTQTCFMSSRDLHTHSGYQMMLAESVAIVCAPGKGDVSHGGDWGVFRLTDPPGKMAILNCQRPGIFHPHDVNDIYTDALRPGHVVEAAGLGFEVVDLRDK